MKRSFLVYFLPFGGVESIDGHVHFPKSKPVTVDSERTRLCAEHDQSKYKIPLAENIVESTQYHCSCDQAHVCFLEITTGLGFM